MSAWRAFVTQKHVWLVAPIATLIGTTAIIDALLNMLGAVSLVSTGEYRQLQMTLELVASKSPLELTVMAVVVLLIAILAITAQAAIVHVMYAHAKAKKPVSLKHALIYGAKRFQALVSMHLIGLVGIGFILYFAIQILSLQTYNPTWNASVTIFAYAFAALGVFLVLAVKLIAIQLAVGAKLPAVDALSRAVEYVRWSPIVVLEHSVIVFALSTVAALIGIGISAILSYLIDPAILLIYSIFNTAPDPSVLLVTVGVVVYLLIVGAITAFNISAWAQLSVRLERMQLKSRLMHTMRTYVPFLKTK